MNIFSLWSEMIKTFLIGMELKNAYFVFISMEVTLPD